MAVPKRFSSTQANLTIGGDNKGVAAKINLWSLEKYVDSMDARNARLCVRGQVKNAETKEVKMFNDPGELISILGEWNSIKFQQLRRNKPAQIV